MHPRSPLARKTQPKLRLRLLLLQLSAAAAAGACGWNLVY